MDEKYQNKTADELYEYKFAPESAVPIVAINLTHGTGSEANRFAVATVVKKDFKPAIAYDCIYPTYSIDDPKVCTKLSLKQTLYTSIDAINHVVEASTSKVASPYAISLAKETIRLVAKYLPLAAKNPEDLEARYFLMYAALLGGICFDNGLLHYTHALEHPLSAVKHDLSHGLGLAIARNIVLNHNGNISVFSKDNYTVFKVILPNSIPGILTATLPLSSIPRALYISTKESGVILSVKYTLDLIISLSGSQSNSSIADSFF